MLSPLAKERYEAFAEYVSKKGKRGRWLVLTHDNPDPDALASAITLATLLRRGFSRSVTAAYGGIIGRAENQEMVRTLGLRLSRLRRLKWSNYRHFALVDCQPGTGNSRLPKEIRPDVVIDHHPRRRETQRAHLADVRPEYGATATILGEYLVASGAEVTKVMATALVYAIRSETQEFGRQSGGPDKAIYDSLFSHADKRHLARIQYPRLPVSYFQTLHEALENLYEVNNLVICHLGVIEQPDIVPEIADLLLRMEGKTWALTSGIHGERVYFSIRTTNARADAGRLMRRLLGKRGKGGGHGMTAGGWMPIDSTPDGDPVKLQESLGDRLARALRKNPDKMVHLALNAEWE